MDIFLFEVNDDNTLSVSIKDDVCDEIVSIPTYGPENRPITKISKYGFQGNQYIRKVIIPDGVRTIDNGAFGKCFNLQEVVLPETLKVIKANAFRECSSLVKISLPSHISQIGVNAFFECSSLHTINIPASVNFIADCGFRDCFNLTIHCITRAQSQKWGPAWATNVSNVVFADATEVRFGEQPIPNKIRKVYKQAIAKFFGEITLLTSDEISALKGMCNRCIKHDQSDWRTTYSMIGSPERTILKSYVDEIVSIRDDVRLGNYSNVIAFRDKYYDIFKNTYEELCGDLTEEYVTVAPKSMEQNNLNGITEEQYIQTIDENDSTIQEQIENIERFVNSFSPDKNEGRYSNRLKITIARKLIDSGLISNVAFGKRGSEYIAWIPSIDIIGNSSEDSKDAVTALGKKIVVACRQGLKNYYKKDSQFSGVLYGEDYSLLTSDKKYDELIEVLKDALAPVAKTVQAGRATMVLKRLYDLNIIDSPVDSFARDDQYVAKIPGIEIEGVSYSTGSITHVKNAANKDLVEKILRHHKDGSLRGLISASFFGTMNEDWLLSEDDSQNESHHDTGSGTDDNDAPKNTTTKETKNTIPKPTINTTVNLSQLDFSFEEKDDDDDLNF